ncbi:hypothetical protein GCM10023187_07390 [Nibrella viscosa]|uniref:Uncharacterized protein n=1 Tax=Nibrella viscosa TaxID=1084524 RepID=A0ABP8JXS7_9BACT
MCIRYHIKSGTLFNRAPEQFTSNHNNSKKGVWLPADFGAFRTVDLKAHLQVVKKKQLKLSGGPATGARFSKKQIGLESHTFFPLRNESQV